MSLCHGCNSKVPSYGRPGEGATRCAGCKLDVMVSVIGYKCQACKLKAASFGTVAKRPTHCRGCMAPGMQNVVHAMCRSCGAKNPYFGLPGEKATHCEGCSLAGMVNVKSRACRACGRTQPKFAPPGERPSHCGRCRLGGMVDVVTKLCLGCGLKQPCYGTVLGKPTHCAACRTSEMSQRQCNKACGSCGLLHTGKSLEGGMCPCCRKGVSRVELRVRRALETLTDSWVFDKVVSGVFACSDRRYRPDAWLELAGHVVVVECDEHQHASYSQPCELRRLVELWAACEGKPLQVIRWNPDAFSVGGRRRQVSERRRLQVLAAAAEAAMAAQPEEPLMVRYLYYDTERETALQSALSDAVASYTQAGAAQAVRCMSVADR